jgi:hypothetical protein
MKREQEKVYQAFCSRYRARVRESQESFYRREPISYSRWNIDPQTPFHQTLETMSGVDISMSQEDFGKLLDIFEEIQDPYSNWSQFEYMSKHLGPGWVDKLLKFKHQQEQDERIRHRNPGVQKAYDNYMMLLRIAGD